MEETSYYLSFVFTSILCGTAILFFRKNVINGTLAVKKAKNIYSFISVSLGVCGGTLIFHGLILIISLSGSEPNLGHGEILVAAIVYNFLLSLVLMGIGRILIGWEKLNW